MICPPCKTAGLGIGDLKLVVQEKRRNFEGIKRQIQKLHKKCQAPTTCPCHHEITLEALDD